MSSIARLIPWASTLALLAACNAIVGIDDIYEGPRPGAGGAKAEGGGGAEPEGGAKAEGGSAGTVVPQGGSDAEPMGGSSAQGGEGPSPSAGDGSGGAPEPVTGTVTGHVIDFWRHPLQGISVQIGDKQATTNANGAFTVEDVPETYDVSMVYSYDSAFQVAAWAYLGLTRRDPTLQMYVGSERRVGELEIAFVPQPTLAANQKIAVAVGGVDSANTYDPVSVGGTTEFPDWYGPLTASQTGHGLLWQTNAQKLPTSYIAYHSESLQLDETMTTTLTLNLTPSTIATENIQGTVTPAGFGTRHNLVFLRFTSNATLQLVSHSGGPNALSYLAPSIPNSTLMLAATEGAAFDRYAVAWADGLAPDANAELTIPTPMTPATPSSGAINVDDSTRFSFGGDTPGPYVVNFYSQDPDDPNAPPSRYQTIYVVTAQNSFTLPSFLDGGFTLYPNRRYIWTVATHGAYASMDELVSEDGFLDPFSWDEETAQGPAREKGEFTDSDYLEFRTAP
jgi:hypothetical protein